MLFGDFKEGLYYSYLAISGVPCTLHVCQLLDNKNGTVDLTFKWRHSTSKSWLDHQKSTYNITDKVTGNLWFKINAPQSCLCPCPLGSNVNFMFPDPDELPELNLELDLRDNEVTPKIVKVPIPQNSSSPTCVKCNGPNKSVDLLMRRVYYCPNCEP